MEAAAATRDSSPNGVRILVLVLAVTALSLIVAVAGVVFVLDLGDPRQAESDSGYQNWAVLGSFVVGTAAAVSVAWATVRLAQAAHDASAEALQIARRQEGREQLLFLETRIEALIERFFVVSVAVREFVASTTPIYFALHDAPKIATPPYLELPAPELAAFESHLRDRLELAAAKVGHLEAALAALSDGATGRRLAQDVLGHVRPGGLRAVVDRLSTENRLEPGLEELTVADLRELQSLLTLRQHGIAHADLETVVACQIAATNMSGGNAALSNLYFAGNLLWGMWSQGIYVSFGTAILSDLKQMLPVDRNAMASVIARAYLGGVSEADISQRLPTGALFDLGESLEQGFAEYDMGPAMPTFPALEPTKYD